jgi:hypothetical protein
MTRLLLDRSGGITGGVTRLLSRAAAEAIMDGTEFITVERINAISQRTTIAA